MTGKERYEARRQLEHDNEIARMKMQKTHYEKSQMADEVTVRLLEALDAFLKGEASILVSDSMGTGGMNGRRVTFQMPPKPQS